MGVTNAKRKPVAIIHAIVLIQAAVRTFTLRKIQASHTSPHIRLAVYLSRRARNGDHMDVDDEIDILGSFLCSRDPIPLSQVLGVIHYCDEHQLQAKRGYILMKEKLNLVVITAQDGLMKLIKSPGTDYKFVSMELEALVSRLPPEMHHHLEFAANFVATQKRELEESFSSRVESCRTVNNYRQLGEEARGRLPPDSAFPERIQSLIDLRKETIRDEILTMYDHPLVDGEVPHLEAVAFEYASELSADDSVLRNFVVDICFLFIKYLKMIEDNWDIRDELNNFTYCKRLGANHILPLIRKNTTPHEFRSVVSKLIGSLSSGESPRAYQTQVFRIRNSSGFRDLKPDVDEFDVGNIWDLLGDNFELPLIPAVPETAKEVEPEMEAPKPVAHRRPSAETKIQRGHEPYTYFQADLPFRIPVAQRRYVTTCFPSHTTT